MARPAAPTFAALSDSPRTVSVAVEALREFLDLEVAWVASVDEAEFRFTHLEGDAESFGFQVGASLPAEESYCRRMLDGRIPPVVPDTALEPELANLPVTHSSRIGSYVSVPVHFSTGETYGALCAAGHQPDHSLDQRDLDFLHVFGRVVADQLEREQMVDRAHRLEVEAAASAALLGAASSRDAYTPEHAAAMASNAEAVARELNLDEDEIAEVGDVVRVHDIGKLAIPDTILAKPGELDDHEWDVIRTHPARGQEMVALVPGLESLAPLVGASHERWDGTGYPEGLDGEDIPLASRITLVCDAYQAMVSDRPYRPAMTEEQARAELESCAGRQFCPAAALALLRVLERA